MPTRPLHPIRSGAVGAVLALVVGGTALAGAPAAEPDHPMLGEPAPAFSLPSATGQTVALSEYAGSFLVIHFGTSW